MLTKFLSIYCLLYLSSDIIKVTATQKVKIQITSGSNPLKEKEKLSLQCLLSNNSKSVLWKWQIQTQPYSNKEVHGSKTFSINSVNRKDSGNYTCACYNKTTNQLIAISDKMVLQVYYMDDPSLKFTPGNNVEEGSQVALSCETGASNPPMKAIKYMVGGFDLPQSVGWTSFNPVLTVTKDVVGFYQCSADNGQLKKLSEPVLLGVYDAFEVTIGLSNEAFSYGHPTTMTCNANTKESIRYFNWYKDDTLLNDHNKILSITPNETTNGIYYCEVVTDKVTKKSKTISAQVWIKVSLTPQSLSVKKKEVFHLKCETFIENAATDSVTYHWYKNDVHIDVYQPLAEFSVEEDTRFKCGVQRGTTLYGASEVASVEIKADIETGVLVGIILGAIIAALLLIIIIIWCGYCFVKKKRELQDNKMRQKRLEELEDYILENGHVLENVSQKGRSESRLVPLSDVIEKGSLFYEELTHPQLVPKRHRTLILTKSNTSSVINDPLYPVDDEPITNQPVEKLNSEKFSDPTKETAANDSGPMEQVSNVDDTDKENKAYPNTSTHVKHTPESPTENSENVPELLSRLRKSPIIDLHRSQEDIEQTLNNTEPSYENVLKIKSFIYNGDSEENSDGESRRSYPTAAPHKKKSETYPNNNRYAYYDSSSESEDENVYGKENNDVYDESDASEYENRHVKLNNTLSYASSYSVRSERESDSEIENYNSPRNSRYQDYEESGSDSEMEASGNQNSFYNINNNSFANSEIYSDDDNESGYFNEKDSNKNENIYEENDFSGSDYESGSSAKTQNGDTGVLQKEHVSLEIPIIITPDSSC